MSTPIQFSVTALVLLVLVTCLQQFPIAGSSFTATRYFAASNCQGPPSYVLYVLDDSQVATAATVSCSNQEILNGNDTIVYKSTSMAGAVNDVRENAKVTLNHASFVLVRNHDKLNPVTCNHNMSFVRAIAVAAMSQCVPMATVLSWNSTSAPPASSRTSNQSVIVATNVPIDNELRADYEFALYESSNCNTNESHFKLTSYTSTSALDVMSCLTPQGGQTLSFETFNASDASTTPTTTTTNTSNTNNTLIRSNNSLATRSTRVVATMALFGLLTMTAWL